MSSRRPRVLVLTPFLPAPPYDGGKKRVHTILRLLSRQVDFTLLSFINNAEEMWHVPSLKKFCRRVITVPREQDRLGDTEEFLTPEVVKACFSHKYLEALQTVLEQVRPDLVHFEFIQMAIYRPWVRSCPAVLTEHDISNISFFRSYFREMTGWKRWGRMVEWMRLVKFQIDACRAFEGIVTLTPEDTVKLGHYVAHPAVRCIPTGVDLSHFKFRRDAVRPRRDTEAHLVYVGHYLHYPNEDAVVYFCRRIFPRIVEKCPIVRLWIVGSGVTPAVEALKADPRIQVTGPVPDVKPFLDRADVYVAPLRLGEGIKGKILEAFATGVPVVTTPVGARGLAARSGQHLLVAKDEDDFAEKTVRAIFDLQLRRKLILQARKLAEESYDWARLSSDVLAFYRDILSRSRAEGQRPGTPDPLSNRSAA